VIRAARCEVSIVAGCGLACRACHVLAPLMGAYAVPPETVHEDLSMLARHYRAERVDLGGGEPLLHPALPEVSAAVRSSGVGGRLRWLRRVQEG
jgi:GTP 3',8-cyclase